MDILFCNFVYITYTRRVVQKTLEGIGDNESMSVQNIRFRYFLLTTKKEVARIMSRYPESMVEQEKGGAEC